MDLSLVGTLPVSDDLGTRFDEHARGGQVFLYDLGANRACTLEVYINEDPPSTVAANALESMHGLSLELPSGRLVACGIEQLVNGAQRPADYNIVTPGRYDLNAYVLRVDESDQKGRIKHNAIGCGCLLTLASLFVGVAALVHSGSVLGWPLVAAPLAIWGGYLLWYNVTRGWEREPVDERPEIVVRLALASPRKGKDPPEMGPSAVDGAG
jgi:hypothetical protein